MSCSIPRRSRRLSSRRTNKKCKRLPKLGLTTQAFKEIDSQASHKLDRHARYWWRSSGHALAILLDRASYSRNSQCIQLQFFLAIASSLGPGHIPGRRLAWKSFMTDDHVPVELSWDWGAGTSTPKIRFAVEPVGVYAGTHMDRNNDIAGPLFVEQMRRLVPDTNMEWLAYFQRSLNGEEARVQAEGHPSREFYAFDLGEDGIVSKAYFFPGRKATAMGLSNLEIILDTIRKAPGASAENLDALGVFEDFARDPSTPALEMDMLAIDLVKPETSRFKIYFRIRNGTCFASVREAMTLMGRITGPKMDRGLREMKLAYHELMGHSPGRDISEDVPLPANSHRTAGMFYNAEFRFGSSIPKVKAYLPVRHYARSEAAVISALHAHQRRTKTSGKANILQYVDALSTIL